MLQETPSAIFGGIPQPAAIPIVEKLPAELEVPPFDPLIHLDYQPPSRRWTFTELGLPVPKGLPDVCYTAPFQIFSEEGVRMIRREIFRKSFLDKYMRSWERSPCIITGFSQNEQDAIFMKTAMSHPATQGAINHAFGADLALETGINDMGYINVQLGAEGRSGVYKLTEEPSKPLPPGEKLAASEYDAQHIDSWHKDMCPVVMVMMLSDTTTMEGGETAVRTGNGKSIAVRGASMGGAVMMAGGYLEHAALRATNTAERLSLVNSYYFRSPDADDTATSLKSAHFSVDDHGLIRNLFLQHKLRRMTERCSTALERLEKDRRNGVAPDQEAIEAWVKDQIFLLKHTAWEAFQRWPNYLHQETPYDQVNKYLD
ncbi:unnamed protein product [Clonostachys byssicola]|uniref:Uncharacterized protein n=1 Tax=Clonostachys byssicola TaxID=160290 RepID=A0A9N9UHA6_9HYPO|nr:unnamed protein product [Clonostachys byssicola]